MAYTGSILWLVILGGFYNTQPCHGLTEVVQLLLDRGADVDSESGALVYPLAWAISQGHKDTVELLLDRGAKTDNWVGSFFNARQCANMYDREEMTQLLLRRRATG